MSTPEEERKAYVKKRALEIAESFDDYSYFDNGMGVEDYKKSSEDLAYFEQFLQDKNYIKGEIHGLNLEIHNTYTENYKAYEELADFAIAAMKDNSFDLKVYLQKAYEIGVLDKDEIEKSLRVFSNIDETPGAFQDNEIYMLAGPLIYAQYKTGDNTVLENIGVETKNMASITIVAQYIVPKLVTEERARFNEANKSNDNTQNIQTDSTQIVINSEIQPLSDGQTPVVTITSNRAVDALERVNQVQGLRSKFFNEDGTRQDFVHESQFYDTKTKYIDAGRGVTVSNTYEVRDPQASLVALVGALKDADINLSYNDILKELEYPNGVIYQAAMGSNSQKMSDDKYKLTVKEITDFGERFKSKNPDIDLNDPVTLGKMLEVAADGMASMDIYEDRQGVIDEVQNAMIGGEFGNEESTVWTWDNDSGRQAAILVGNWSKNIDPFDKTIEEEFKKALETEGDNFANAIHATRHGLINGMSAILTHAEGGTGEKIFDADDPEDQKCIHALASKIIQESFLSLMQDPEYAEIIKSKGDVAIQGMISLFKDDATYPFRAFDGLTYLNLIETISDPDITKVKDYYAISKNSSGEHIDTKGLLEVYKDDQKQEYLKDVSETVKLKEDPKKVTGQDKLSPDIKLIFETPDGYKRIPIIGKVEKDTAKFKILISEHIKDPDQSSLKAIFASEMQKSGITVEVALDKSYSKSAEQAKQNAIDTAIEEAKKAAELAELQAKAAKGYAGLVKSLNEPGQELETAEKKFKAADEKAASLRNIADNTAKITADVNANFTYMSKDEYADASIKEYKDKASKSESASGNSKDPDQNILATILAPVLKESGIESPLEVAAFVYAALSSEEYSLNKAMTGVLTENYDNALEQAKQAAIDAAIAEVEQKSKLASAKAEEAKKEAELAGEKLRDENRLGSYENAEKEFELASAKAEEAKKDAEVAKDLAAANTEKITADATAKFKFMTEEEYVATSLKKYQDNALQDFVAKRDEYLAKHSDKKIDDFDGEYLASIYDKRGYTETITLAEQKARQDAEQRLADQQREADKRLADQQRDAEQQRLAEKQREADRLAEEQKRLAEKNAIADDPTAVEVNDIPLSVLANARRAVSKSAQLMESEIKNTPEKQQNDGLAKLAQYIRSHDDITAKQATAAYKTLEFRTQQQSPDPRSMG